MMSFEWELGNIIELNGDFFQQAMFYCQRSTMKISGFPWETRATTGKTDGFLHKISQFFHAWLHWSWIEFRWMCFGIHTNFCRNRSSFKSFPVNTRGGWKCTWQRRTGSSTGHEKIQHLQIKSSYWAVQQSAISASHIQWPSVSIKSLILNKKKRRKHANVGI